MKHKKGPGQDRVIRCAPHGEQPRPSTITTPTSGNNENKSMGASMSA